MESAKKLAAKLPDSITIIKNGIAEGGFMYPLET